MRARSFTLVEMLLAITLTTLLVAGTGRIVVSTLTARRDAERLVSRLEREAYVFDRIGEDVANLLHDVSSDEPTVMIHGVPQQVLQLLTLVGVEPAGTSLHNVTAPARIRYQLMDDPLSLSGTKLVRETFDLTRFGGPHLRETIATGLSRFEVQVLVGTSWRSRYPDDRNTNEAVRAFRVSLRWQNGDGNENTFTRTFVPPEVSP